MAEALKKFYGGVLSGSGPDLIYTVPAGTTAVVKEMHFSNVAAASATITFWQGGSADANLLRPATPIGVGESGTYQGALTLAAGDTLYAEASAASAIALQVNGIEFT